MKRARFVAPAREEFLAEVDYYNQVQPGQGARFAAAVKKIVVEIDPCSDRDRLSVA